MMNCNQPQRKCCFYFLFNSNSTVRLTERNGFWSQVYLNGFLVQPLTGCMTTFKLFNVTCAMGIIDLPCNCFKNYKKYNQKVPSTVPGTKQDSINGSYYESKKNVLFYLSCSFR